MGFLGKILSLPVKIVALPGQILENLATDGEGDIIKDITENITDTIESIDD
jgi:hypothetical protein